MVPNGDQETGGCFLFEMSTDQAHSLMEDINQALLDAEGKQ